MSDQRLVRISKFLGFDPTSDPYNLPPELAASATNFDPRRRYGALVAPLGRKKQVSGPFQATPAQVFLAPDSYSTRIDSTFTLLAYSISGGVAYFQYTKPSTGLVATYAPLPAGPFPTSTPYSFAEFNNLIYATGYLASVYSRVVFAPEATSYLWKLSPPNSAPTGSATTGGALSGLYWYCYTFNSANTGETSRSPVFGPISVSGSNNAVALASLVDSTEETTATKNLYRIGGSLQSWQQVATIAHGTTTYTDTLADANVTGGTLVLHRDPPPQFVAMATHKGRIWGWPAANVNYTYVFGANNAYGNMTLNGGDLWFSAFNDPSFDSVNNIIPTDHIDIADVGVNLFSIGSLLIGIKYKSLWVVYGDSESDFRAVKYANIGASGSNLTASGYGFVFFLSADGNAWQTDGSSLVNISEGNDTGGIRGILQTEVLNAQTNGTVPFAKFIMFVYDRALFVVDTSQGLGYCYNLRTGHWFPLTLPLVQALVDKRVSPPRLFGFQPNALYADLMFWREGDDYNGGLVTTWISSEYDSDEPGYRKQYRYADIEIAPGDPNNTIRVDFIVDGVIVKTEAGLHPRALGVNGYAKAYYRSSFSARGYRIAIKITITNASTTTMPGVVQGVSVFGTVLTSFDPTTDGGT